MAENFGLKLYETRTISKSLGFSGSDVVPFYIISGSRILLSFQVDAIDLGATISFAVDNTFDPDGPWDQVLAVSADATGLDKRVLSDFHTSFRIRVTVTGGSASWRIGATVYDNALATKIENATIDVNLNALPDAEGRYDSVRVADEDGDELEINPDGSINVSSSGEVKNTFNSISSLASGGTSAVVSYTVPFGKVFYLNHVEFSGNNIATYDITADAVAFARKRSWFGTDLSGDFDFRVNTKKGMLFTAGQEIRLVVYNFRPTVGDFEGRIYGIEDEAP